MSQPAGSRVALKVEIAQHSDPGRDPNKQVNEDSCGFAMTKFGHLCVLCDGMGGHYGGQEASRRAISTIFEQFEKAPDHLSPATALKLSIEEAARRVYELGGPPDNKARPGSTIVAMLLHDSGVDVAHVGDSRAFVVRSGQIYPLTRDHSMVQGMIDAGYLTEEQAIGHPDANKITRALGMKPDVEVELRPEPMELFPGDILLQASDGLTDLALGHEILGALRQALNQGNSLDFACQQLVRMANERGGHDNITVQIARVVSTAPKVTRAGYSPIDPSELEATAVAPESRRVLSTVPMVSSTTPDPQAPPPPAPTAMGSAPGMLAHGMGSPALTPLGPTGTLGPGAGAQLNALAALPGMSPPAPTVVGPSFGTSQPHDLPPSSMRYPHPHGSSPNQYAPHQVPSASPSHRGQVAPTHPGFDSPTSGSGSQRSSVLFLWLGASFFVASIALVIVWALFLR